MTTDGPAAKAILREYLQAQRQVLLDKLDGSKPTASPGAAEIIKGNTTPKITDGGLVKWWDLASWEGDDTEPLVQAERYLAARGLLDYHPTNKHWVRPRRSA